MGQREFSTDRPPTRLTEYFERGRNSRMFRRRAVLMRLSDGWQLAGCSIEAFTSVESLPPRVESRRYPLALLHEDEEGSIEILESSLFELGASIIVDQDELDIGQKLGSYEIRSLLGSGGMGSVYLAEDLRLNRKAALKVLPLITTAGFSAIEQFHREARAASGIAHQNIAHIYEFSEFEGRHYLAMEYVEGSRRCGITPTSPAVPGFPGPGPITIASMLESTGRSWGRV